MKTKTEVETSDCRSLPRRGRSYRGRSSRSPWSVIALLALGMLMGTWWQGSSEPHLFAYDPQATYGNDDNAAFTFVPFRRNLWVIDHENDSIKFFMFPSSDARPVQPSLAYKIDRTEFPAEVVRFQVSDHNVTSFLWILNPETGKGRYIKALRDGKIEESILVDVTKGI